MPRTKEEIEAKIKEITKNGNNFGDYYNLGADFEYIQTEAQKTLIKFANWLLGDNED